MRKEDIKGRIMALDLGSQRVGVAISDPEKIFASSIGTFPASIVNQICWVEDMIKKYEIAKIVIGYPILLNGTEGGKAKAAKEFAERIQKELNIKVILWDERLTTIQANRTMKSMDISHKKRKKGVDSISAVLILQNYLDSLNP